MKVPKILIGKSKDDILTEFRQRLNVNYENVDHFWNLVSYLEKPKIHLTMKWQHWTLVWAIPCILIGLSGGIALIWEMSVGGFPWIIEGFEGFKGKFVNICQLIVMIGGCLLMIIIPFVRMNWHYDWGW